MTPIEWPSILPCLRFDPYSVRPRPGSLQLDLGQITRLAHVYLNTNETVSCELILNSAQEQALRTFYKTTLGMGTQSFNMDVWISSALESRESLFVGAPPTFVPVAEDHTRVTFTLLTWPNILDPVYELTATQAVNIDANDFALSASIPSVPSGTIVTINAVASDQIRITKPSIAVDVQLTWDAWSAWATDAGNGDNLAWLNRFLVSNEDDDQILDHFPAKYANAALALAGSQAVMPITLSGYTQYQFWSFDSPINDNRQGLSLRVETYSLVT